MLWSKIGRVELRGDVRPDRPLLVVALEEEADALGEELPVLISGPGKVHAAVAVSTALASVRPTVLVNVGTAGGLRDGLQGVHEVHTVVQHDFDSDAILSLVNRDYGTPIRLDSPASETRMVLATGDRLIADSRIRELLAREADLVDMEGYAVARAARAAGVPVRLIKRCRRQTDAEFLAVRNAIFLQSTLIPEQEVPAERALQAPESHRDMLMPHPDQMFRGGEAPSLVRRNHAIVLRGDTNGFASLADAYIRDTQCPADQLMDFIRKRAEGDRPDQIFQ